MTFIDQRLSKSVEAGFTGGPEWKTLIVPMSSGREARRGQWSMPHFKFSADYTVLNPREQNDILAAFMAARGQLHSFRFKDWNDFKAAKQVLGVGNGTSSPMQLVKHYEFGPSSYTRVIELPIAVSVAVQANGVPVSVSIDEDTGQVTPMASWPSGQSITADFEFDVRVRFAADHFPFTQHAKSVSHVSIDLLEVIA